MKMKTIFLSTLVTGSIFFSSCGGKTTEECRSDADAYQFGRDMQAYVELRSAGLSLEDAIEEYSESLGLMMPYDASNECVKRGFQDAEDGKDNPFN
jgi:hypothetical protein